jgi:hypothetical protein
MNIWLQVLQSLAIATFASSGKIEKYIHVKCKKNISGDLLNRISRLLEKVCLCPKVIPLYVKS